jgi:hypothetical protein
VAGSVTTLLVGTLVAGAGAPTAEMFEEEDGARRLATPAQQRLGSVPPDCRQGSRPTRSVNGRIAGPLEGRTSADAAETYVDAGPGVRLATSACSDAAPPR